MKTREFLLRNLNFYMEDNNYKSLEITFEGGGDDGDINHISAEDIWGVTHNFVLSLTGLGISDTYYELYDVFYEIISESVSEYGDWINDQGGYGSLYYELSSNEFKVDYYQRTTENYEIFGKPIF